MTRRASPTLVAVGHRTEDAYPHGVEPGGSVSYAQRAWEALGGRALVVSGAHPVLFCNRYDPDGTRTQHASAPAPPVTPRSLGAPWSCPDVVLLCPVLGEVDLDEWRPFCHKASLLALGLQGWLKHAGRDGGVVHGPAVVCTESFSGVDVAFLSDEDLAGDARWLDALCETVPLVYLTRGAKGATVCCGSRRAPVSAHPTAVVVDPTGAGDTFAAATLRALVDGAEPCVAAAIGARVAAVVVSHVANNSPSAALRAAFEAAAQSSQPLVYDPAQRPQSRGVSS